MLDRHDVGGHERAQKAHDNAAGAYRDGEHQTGPAARRDEGGRVGRHDEGGAGGFRKGAEEVAAHAGHVPDVVPDVIRNSGGVPRVVFGDVLHNLTGEIGADVGGFRVDAAAHAAEQRDGAAAEAVAGEALGEL